MIRSFLLLLSFLLVSSSSVAQTLVPELGRAFRDDRVPRIDIEIAPADLDFLLDPSNAQSDEYKSAHFYWDDGEKKDTVRFVGFRLRGNTSRNAQKKSFKISFDEIIAGQEFKKLERMNLNGEHNDPSVVRSKLSWDLLRQIGIPGSRVNHVDLYINRDYFGVYANIEMIDDEFVQLRYGNKDGNLYKCLWPADLNYVGADPDLYKEITAGSRQAYTLKINEEENDYSDLANFIDILNNTPINDLPCELEAVFNVEDYLKAILVAEQRLSHGELVSMGQVAAALGVAPGTVTSMVKTLRKGGLVTYEPYSGVRLTGEGRQLGLHVLRRHRLIELFLVEVLGLDWSEVHEEAELLEHAMSDKLVDRIDNLLGNPRTDPHGDPIPDVAGELPAHPWINLSDFEAEGLVRIARVTDQDESFLRFAERCGLKPGSMASVAANDPAAGVVTLHPEGREAVTLGREAAAKLWIEPASPESQPLGRESTSQSRG